MLRTAVKAVARQIPPIDRIIRQRDELLTKVERLSAVRVAPAPSPLTVIPAPPSEPWDHSQNGEFHLLVGAMIERTVKHKFVVDVGACRKAGSNSYDLMLHFGWRGILVEPNPHLLDRIKSEFNGFDYKLMNVAAASYSGEATLHLGVDEEISSIHRHQTEQWGPVHDTVRVTAERLPVILQQNDVPQEFGLLSIDAEGEGFNLFDDALAAGYRPTWVIIEVYMGLETKSLDQHPASDEIKRHYRIVGRTYPNLILERITAPRQPG